MTIHDAVHIGGVSEACKYNDHADCRASGCACECHVIASKPPIPTVEESKQEKCCSKCGVKRPFSETFCRLDGTRLSSLICGVCGAVIEPEDKFCWGCGAGKGAVGDSRAEAESVTSLSLPHIHSPSKKEIDYASQVLHGLQDELGKEGDNVPTQTAGGESRKVVEEIGGAGGSFKLVSAPPAGRVRTGMVEVATGPLDSTAHKETPENKPRPKISLPIKPA